MTVKSPLVSRMIAFPSFFIYLAMVLLGLVSGYSDVHWLQQIGIFISDVFIKIFSCISIPIVSLSIIVTLANYRSEGGETGVWRRAMCYTLGTTLIAASISALLYLIIQPGMMNTTPLTSPLKAADFNYFSHLTGLIPADFISPFIDHQVISVLLLSLLFGMAIRFIPDKAPREAITHFFQGAHGLLMVITRWIIRIIPLGMYGFITSTVVQLRGNMSMKGIGEYLLIIVLANLIQGFVFLPLWLRGNGLKPLRTMKNMLPALSLAFFSKSSVGTLPVTMETAEKNLGVKPEISRFVLPLCTSLNMNGCAAFIFVTVIYLMQNHGIIISLPLMALWIVIATVAAIGNAGVPMGCFFLSASLLASMNVPITLMGIILPFYTLIDMLETALNVWSDSCVTVVVNEKQTQRQGIAQGVIDNNAAAVSQ